jgi:hypothetical protein
MASLVAGRQGAVTILSSFPNAGGFGLTRIRFVDVVEECL